MRWGLVCVCVGGGGGSGSFMFWFFFLIERQVAYVGQLVRLWHLSLSVWSYTAFCRQISFIISL